jgi:hypothetical protein
MANKLPVIGRLRPKIISRGIVDIEEISRRVSKNTTFNPAEILSVLKQFTDEANAAIQAGEIVKIDGLVKITANMKVGGLVDMALRPDRSAIADLNDPTLWTADKVYNHDNLTKSTEELVMQWNEEHADDPVID